MSEQRLISAMVDTTTKVHCAALAFAVLGLFSWLVPPGLGSELVLRPVPQVSESRVYRAHVRKAPSKIVSRRKGLSN